jgi:hypothetical protein
MKKLVQEAVYPNNPVNTSDKQWRNAQHRGMASFWMPAVQIRVAVQK